MPAKTIKYLFIVWTLFMFPVSNDSHKVVNIDGHWFGSLLRL